MTNYPFLIFAYPKGKKVTAGEMNRPGVFRKKVRKKEHLYMEMPSWAIDRELVINRLKDEAQDIEVWEKDEQKMYKISMEKFLEKGVRREFGKHGEQLFCPLMYWEIHHPDGTITPPEDERKEIEKMETQASLF